MKRMLATIALAVAGLSLHAQNVDPIVMNIAGVDVTRSEFEYNYNKNNTADVLDRKAVNQYVDMFVAYRLKVQAAKDMRMDTLNSFQSEFRTIRDQQIRPLLVSSQAVESEVQDYYRQMQASLGGKDLRLPAHIFLPVAQNATIEEQARQKALADSLYDQLCNHNADFAELAKQYSQDTQSARRGGELMWCGPGQLIPDFEQVMYALKKGELGKPFLSSVGFHIVRLNDVKELEPYDTLRPQILKFLEGRGLRDRLAARVVDSLATATTFTPQQLMDREAERLCAEDSDLKYLIQEYHDGLLFYEYCKTHIWEPAKRDTAGMERYFKKHKKDYAWDKPHFNGMLYHTRQQADLKKVQKMLKKVEPKDWTTVVRKNMNVDSVMVRMEQRMFVQGENATVDSLAFKIRKGKTVPYKGFPYSAVIGTKLKKGPKRWTDVSALVAEDYQAQREREVVDELRKRYEVKINADALKTVNNH